MLLIIQGSQARPSYHRLTVPQLPGARHLELGKKELVFNMSGPMVSSVHMSFHLIPTSIYCGKLRFQAVN